MGNGREDISCQEVGAVVEDWGGSEGVGAGAVVWNWRKSHF